MAYVFCLTEDAVFLRRIDGALKFSLPYWCILVLYFVLRLRVLGFLVIRQRNWILSPFEFGLTTLNLILKYCWKLLAPVGLNAYYLFVPCEVFEIPAPLWLFCF